MNISVLKKVNTFVLTLLVFFSVISTSCERKSKSYDYEVIFDTIQVNKTESIDYKKSKLNCDLHISFIYPVTCKKTSMLNDLQKLFIERVFPPQYSNFPPKEAVEKFVNQYIDDYKSIKAEDFFEEDYILEDENEFIYELYLENEILYYKNNLISFIVKSMNYEGGAHASNSVYCYVIDLNKDNILSEADFAENNYKENLAPILAKKIATAKGLDDVSQLEGIGYTGLEDIVPNDNFIIDDKGITYYFNEYEIAAYFIGVTEVFIPYEELKDFITKDNPIYSLAGF